MRRRRYLFALLLPVIVFAMIALLRPADQPGPMVEIAPTTGSDAANHGAALAVLAEPRATSASTRLARKATLAPQATGLDELRPLNAVLIHAASSTPIPHLKVIVIDSNGVSVAATSGLRGRLQSAELLKVGPVAIFCRPESVPSAARRAQLTPVQLEKALFKAGRQIAHHGTASEPAPWALSIERRLALDLQWDDPDPRHYAVYATAGAQLESTLLALKHSSEIGWSHSIATLPFFSVQNGWRDDQLDQEEGGRFLHAICSTQTSVAAGTVRVGRVRREGMQFLRVPFAPLTLADVPDLNARFGPQLGPIIRRLIEAAHFRLELNALSEVRTGLSVAGTIESQSGDFRGTMRIRATPTGAARAGRKRPIRSGETEVVWLDDGTGRFVIENLDATTYRLTARGSRRPLTRPAFRDVAAPHEQIGSGTPTFLVLDGLEQHAVAVRAQTSSGSWLGGFDALLTATYEGNAIRSAVQAAPIMAHAPTPAPAVVSWSIPTDAEFEVRISHAGYESQVFTRDDFLLVDGIFQATATLAPSAVTRQPGAGRERHK